MARGSALDALAASFLSDLGFSTVLHALLLVGILAAVVAVAAGSSLLIQRYTSNRARSKVKGWTSLFTTPREQPIIP